MRALVLMLLLLVVAWSHEACGQYHGIVLDADTNQPLEGAVVTIVWYRSPIISMEGNRYVHDAKEVLTDREGRFVMHAQRAVDWNPLTYVRELPAVVVFAPGYEPLWRTKAWREGIRDVEAAMLAGLPKTKCGTSSD